MRKLIYIGLLGLKVILKENTVVFKKNKTLKFAHKPCQKSKINIAHNKPIKLNKHKIRCVTYIL